MIRYALSFLLLFPTASFAQEQLGIANSNYAGTDAAPLNPARLAGQWPYLDINLIGLNTSVWNDHVFLSRRDHSFWGDLRAGIKGTIGDFTINESLSPGNKEVFVSAAIKGPAVALSLGKGSVGAHVTTRLHTNAVGIPTELARFMVNGLDYPPQLGDRNHFEHVRIASAAWTEFGATYARILYSMGYQLISAGATINYLQAHHGMAAELEVLDFTVIDTMQAELHEARGSYGFTSPALNAGRGWGADLGVTFERTLDDAERYLPHQASTGCEPIWYGWRAGLSILDIGCLAFNNAYAGSFNASTAYFLDYHAIAPAGIHGMDSLLATSFSSVVRTEGVKIGLPTALAAQFDVNVAPKVYVAANAIQNLAPRSSLRMRRTNTLGIIPRFETERFEVALPIVLHEYDLARPSIGLMIRLNNVVIGSDHVVPMLARTDIYGFDFYVRIKWTIFKSPFCKGKKQARHVPGTEGALPCVDPGQETN